MKREHYEFNIRKKGSLDTLEERAFWSNYYELGKMAFFIHKKIAFSID